MDVYIIKMKYKVNLFVYRCNKCIYIYTVLGHFENNNILLPQRYIYIYTHILQYGYTRRLNETIKRQRYTRRLSESWWGAAPATTDKLRNSCERIAKEFRRGCEGVANEFVWSLALALHENT